MGMVFDKTLFDRYEHVGSPSQLVDYLDCPRKWWFRRCARIPERKDQKKFLFGNVLHAIVERWLSADDQGRVPTPTDPVELAFGKWTEGVLDGQAFGKPVELYPPGWSAGLTPAESALVRKLFEKGVSEGLLRRLPGREVEKAYEREVVPGICSIGALDLTSPEGVEDQKSTKAPCWIMTQQALANDPKMLSYAYEWLQDQWAQLEEERPDVACGLDIESAFPQVKLRLNYFVKDPETPAVKPVEVMVSAGDILRFWEETAVPAYQGMLDLKRGGLPELQWRTVTGPQTKNTCKKYGGCPYASVCGGCSTPAALRQQVERANKRTERKNQTKSTERKMTSMFKKPVKAKAEPAPAPVAETAPVEEVVESPPNAPWAVEGCGACKGVGINKSGNPCQACYHIRKRRGEPTVEDFETWHDDEGNLCWKSDGTPAPAPAAKAEEAKPAEGKAPIAKEPEAKRAKPAKKVDSKPPAAPEPLVQPTKPVSGPGFTLFINAMPVGVPYLDANDLLAREGADLAQSQNADSYYALDPFKRRDVIAEHAGAIAKDLSGRSVVAIGGGQDMKALIEALRPLAATIVHGVF